MKVGSYEESEEYEEDLTEEEDLGVDAEDDVDVDVDDAPVTQTYLYNGAATAIDIDPSDMEVYTCFQYLFVFKSESMNFFNTPSY